VETEADSGFLSILDFNCHYDSEIRIINEEDYYDYYEEASGIIEVDKNTSKMKVGWKKFKIQIHDLHYRCATCNWNIQWEDEKEEEPDYCF